MSLTIAYLCLKFSFCPSEVNYKEDILFFQNRYQNGLYLNFLNKLSCGKLDILPTDNSEVPRVQ